MNSWRGDELSSTARQPARRPSAVHRNRSLVLCSASFAPKVARIWNLASSVAYVVWCPHQPKAGPTEPLLLNSIGCTKKKRQNAIAVRHKYSAGESVNLCVSIYLDVRLCVFISPPLCTVVSLVSLCVSILYCTCLCFEGAPAHCSPSINSSIPFYLTLYLCLTVFWCVCLLCLSCIPVSLLG